MTVVMSHERSSWRLAFDDYALSAVNESGRLRGRSTPPGRGTATCFSNGASWRVSAA